MINILKKNLKLIVFFLISIIILSILYKINLLDFNSLLISIKKKPELIIYSAILYLISIILGGLRYKLILSKFKYALNYNNSLKITASSIFYGQWFPGSSALIELFRIFFLKQHIKIDLKHSIIVAIYDKTLGFLSMIIISVICISIKFNLIDKFGYYFFIMVIIGVLIAHFAQILIFKILKINFNENYSIFFSYEMVISLIISSGIIIIYYVLSNVTNSDINLLDVAVLIPLIAIVALMPLGLGNLGGMQVGTLLIFQFVSEKNSEIVSMSIMFAIITIIVNTILGSIFFKSTLDIFKKTIARYEKQK
jgi:uncharacterized membrane protein YbhN (UPF0104 family)